jgi:hypothetical protein
VRDWRTRTRLRKTLVDERTGWLVRIQATLFHHGIGGVPDQLLRVRGRAFLLPRCNRPVVAMKPRACTIGSDVHQQHNRASRRVAVPG